MKKTSNGVTILELLMVLAVVGVLAAIAIPAYQNYLQRAYYNKIVTAMTPFKDGITECYETTHSLNKCDGGSNHVPANITTSTGPISSIIITNGVITATPIETHGITTTDTYILTPTIVNDKLIWVSSGGAVNKGYAN